jgi:hypothetical protein
MLRCLVPQGRHRKAWGVSPVDGRDVWGVRINRNIAPNSPNLGFSRDADRFDTYREKLDAIIDTYGVD